MNGAPEIERLAYGESLFYLNRLRRFSNAFGCAWGASAPRIPAQSAGYAGRLALGALR